MGFLTAMTHVHRQHTSARVIGPALLLLAAGCGGLRLDHGLVSRPGDWSTFGRNPLRSSTVDAAIRIPLTLAWDYDLAAGTSNGAPVVADSIVLAGTMRGELHAVRLADGKRLGWVNLGDAIVGSPVVAGSTVFVPLSNSHESVVALDLISGQPLWKRTCGDVETSLLLADGGLYGGTTEGSLFCLDPATGTVRWVFAIPENTARKGIRSTPSAWRSLVIFGADNGCLYALDAASGAVRWRCQTDAPIVAPPVADSTLLIVGTTGGTVLALDPQTGSIRWEETVDAPVYGHAVLRPPVTVVVTTGGTVVCLSAQTGEQQWKTDLGAPMVAGPAAADGIMFIGTLRREFFSLSLADGKVLWKTDTEGRIKTSPVISTGTVIVTADDRSMLAFRAEATP